MSPFRTERQVIDDGAQVAWPTASGISQLVVTKRLACFVALAVRLCVRVL